MLLFIVLTIFVSIFIYIIQLQHSHPIRSHNTLFSPESVVVDRSRTCWVRRLVFRAVDVSSSSAAPSFIAARHLNPHLRRSVGFRATRQCCVLGGGVYGLTANQNDDACACVDKCWYSVRIVIFVVSIFSDLGKQTRIVHTSLESRITVKWHLCEVRCQGIVQNCSGVLHIIV